MLTHMAIRVPPGFKIAVRTQQPRRKLPQYLIATLDDGIQLLASVAFAV